MRSRRSRRRSIRSTTRGGRDSSRGKIVADNPHAMSPSSDEFCYSAGETSGWIYGEDRDLILAVSKTLFELYDREEVGACRAEEVC